MRGLAWPLIILAALGCERRTVVDAGASPRAPEVPWQPHGFRAPTLTCELAVPAGLERINPMPDHLVELRSAELPPKTTFIVSERVEETLVAAVERVRAFHGARPVTEEAIDGGRLLTVRREDGQFESVALLARAGLPIVEVLGRYGEEGEKVRVVEVATSLKCSKK